MVTDQIADLLTRIRNAYRANKTTLISPASHKKQQLLAVLEQEGYISGYSVEDLGKGKKQLSISLRYTDSGVPGMRRIQRLSSPGKRVYVGVDDIPKDSCGLGTIVVSSSQGMISDREARERGVGGELICSVF